ncbi:substrate-binding domain-containing protein [Rudanella paleaurantiibacter]|uniref:Substrate-binding domain-containing protein n=1 Tax=Rudanella paleaurantiibacter TaxID=2614655 RepID=A0A7J5U2B7_9BACT|nr:LacI family DNA-binding transcriptional regulator [Rudanella paleaurantiibacter]KAB7731104.1 substrate-binding domain-containing protein [Rudanella paleaurantiibacter]
MKATPVTIKDIARSLNISISTVSRALRGMPEIHPDTRSAVMRLAEELDYQPNQLAKSLLKSRTRTIGVIVPNLSYHFFAAVLNSIEDAAMRAGYSVLVGQTQESYLREKTTLENLLRSQVEGIIMSLSRDTDHYEHVERLIRRNIPLVLFDRHAEGIDVSKVIVDNYQAAFGATEHLIGQGCSRIGFLAGPPHLLLSNQRIAGYRDALRKHQLPVSDRHVFHCDYTQESTVMQTLSITNLSEPLDGLVVISDRVAYPALYIMKQRGVRVPEDLAVVSFNNEPVSAFFSPGLSSVNQPINEIGLESVRLLLAQIEAPDGEVPRQTQVMPTQLIVRESSQRREMPGS